MEKKKNKGSVNFVYVYIFCVGIVSMALEMAASRLFAPLLGTSMIIWSALIGVILLGLALGYFWGGKLADQLKDKRIVYLITLVCGLWIAVLPIITPYIINNLSILAFSATFWLIGAGLVSSLILLLPPTFCLGMVSPIILKMTLTDLSISGEVAGRLYAISTIGNILGIFGASLIAIPYLGTFLTVEIIAGLLILVSLVGLAKFNILPVLVLGLCIALGSQVKTTNSARKTLETKESHYQYLRVEESDLTRYLVINEGGGVQSIYNGGKLSGGYWDYFTPFLGLIDKKEKKKVLILGAAGGTIAGNMKRNLDKNDWPEITGVEIDKEVVKLGEKYFDGKYFDKVVVADAREFLKRNSEKFDLIITDAYSQQLYIPFHMATKEYFSLVKEHLNDGGLALMNVNASDYNSPLLASLVLTLNQSFKNVYISKIEGSEMNYMLIGSNEKNDWKQLDKSNFELTEISRKLLAGMKEYFRVNGKHKILTDNKAPLEYLTDGEIWSYLKSKK